MSDKFDETEHNGVNPEESSAKVTGEVGYEDNDNWEFEAVAHTLENTVVENGEFEIVLPDKEDLRAAAPQEKPQEDEAAAPAPQPKARSAAYETRERPSAAKQEVTEKSETKAKQNGKSNKGKIICGVLVGLIVAVVLVFFGWRYYTVPNSQEKMNYGNVALTVGDEDVSIGMYNYYYNTIFQNYASYAQQGYYTDLDLTKDFSKQKTTTQDGKQTTWDKLFVKETTDRLQYILALYHEGVEHGVELTADQKKSMKENLQSLKDSAAESDTSVDEYIAENYGDYCGLATIKKMLTQAFIANNYYRQYLIENTPEKKEIDAYFKKNKDKFTQVKMAYLPIPYNADDASAKASTEASARKYAKKIKSLDDMKLALPKACKQLIDQYVSAGYFEDAESCAAAIAGQLEIDLVKSDNSFPKDGVEWLFNDATKVNATKVVTDAENSVVYIIIKLSDASLSDQETYSVRHILITPEADENADTDKDGNVKYTKKAWAAAEKKAKKILKEFNGGDKKEITFAELAEQYSSDTESTSKGQSGLYGGLYEGVELGKMVPSFEKWATDKSRKYGDTGIVKSDYGYHIIFFIVDEPYYVHECKSAVTSENGEKLIASYKIKKHDGPMKKTTVAKPEKAEDTTADANAAADSAVISGADDE